MQARKTLICDTVQDLRQHKKNLLGVFDRYRLPPSSLPYELRPFTFYTTLHEDQPGELKSGKTRVKIELENPTKKRFPLVDSIVPPQAETGIRSPDGLDSAEIVLEIQGITVASFGRYWIVIEVDGVELDRASFLVEKL